MVTVFFKFCLKTLIVDILLNGNNFRCDSHKFYSQQNATQDDTYLLRSYDLNLKKDNIILFYICQLYSFSYGCRITLKFSGEEIYFDRLVRLLNAGI